MMKNHEIHRLAGVLFNIGRDETGVAESARYRLTRLVDVGGMGEVYEAEQLTPRRRVAVKIVRPSLFDEESSRRFKHEISILGSLHHPGIAQIYDAGRVTPEQIDPGDTPCPAGAPYFAMEFVEGRNLVRHAEAEGLGTRSRLELFIKVCDAVAHAHQRGVIHRDLKPANVLVSDPPHPPIQSSPHSHHTHTHTHTHLSAPPEPKILDFGIARATNADIAVTTVGTHVGQLLGTLPYMSPEQAAGTPSDLDTRTDVYSLGVILYELLTGRLPLRMSGEGGAGIAAALRAIREEDPPPLSTINRTFRGDLDTIVAKAIEKDRDRRYQSVQEFVADLRRHLNNEPIVARPASAWYQARKFAQRHRALVGAAASVLATLLVSVVLLAWFLHRANVARADAAEATSLLESKTTLAERRAAHSDAVADFLQSVLISPELGAKGLGILDRTMQDLRDHLSHTQPDVAAALATYVARSYQGLGGDAAAESSLLLARDWWKLVDSPDPIGPLRTEHFLLWAARDRIPPEETLRLTLALRDRARRELRADHPFLHTMSNDVALAHARAGDLAGAEREFRTLLDALRASGQEQTPTGLSAAVRLGEVVEKLQRLDEAASLYTTVLDVHRTRSTEDQPDAQDAVLGLARIASTRGRPREAIGMLRPLWARQRELYGDHSEQAVSTGLHLALIMSKAGDLDEALSIATSIHEILSRNIGPDAPTTLTATDNIAFIHARRGELEEAVRWYRYSIDARARLGIKSLAAVEAAGGCANALEQLGRLEEAAQVCEQTFPLVQQAAPHLEPVLTFMLGRLRLRQERTDEAEQLLLRAADSFTADLPRARHALRRTWQSLAELYRKTGDDAKAGMYEDLLKSDDTPGESP